MTTKESQTKKAGNNFIMPIILFLVSAFVITATFYEDRYKNVFTLQKDVAAINNVDVVTEEAIIKNNVTSSTQAITKSVDKEKVINVIPVANETTQTQSFLAVTNADRNTKVTNSSKKSTSQESTSQKSTSKETTAQEQTSLTAETIPSVTEQATAPPMTDAKDIQIHSDKSAKFNNQNVAQNYTAHNYNPNNYAARNHAPTNHTESNQSDHQVYKQQRQQYFTALQQRRQAYQNEIRKRQKSFLSEMKAQQEQRNKSFAANKAIYLQDQKKRYEADQKIQQIQNQISQLNEEIRQLRLNPSTAIKDFPTSQSSMPTSKQM